MRDNTLAAALARLACDIHLIPTYTPIRTDEESVAVEQVFFGGINVFLQQKSALFRRLPGWLARILDRPRLINWAASRGIRTDARQLGELTLSMLKGESGHQRKEVDRLVVWLRDHVRPDVVNFTNVLIGGSIPAIRRETGAKILVTLQGDDLFLSDLPEPFQSASMAEIRRIARDVDGWIVFSRYYADFMSGLLGLDRSKFHVVPLGLRTDDSSPPPPRPADRPPTIGYLARICPAKGFHVLVEAFQKLRESDDMRRCRLRAAGWLGAGDRPFYEEQVANLERAGLRGEFRYEGVVDRAAKLRFLHEVDVLCVPTVYREPKGLFALEAMANGTPAALPAHGAFPEMIARAPGGLLHPPGDVDALVGDLRRLLSDPEEARRLGAAGREAVLRDCSAEVMARRTLEVYRQVLNDGPAASGAGEADASDVPSSGRRAGLV
jgi:glycosyltransferase involved in cell wall biosynthesis